MSLVTSASSAGPAARMSLLNPSPARLRRASLASPRRRPLPSCHPGFLPAEFPPREEKNKASLVCVQPHLSVGRRERQTQPSVPRRSRQGREERDDLFSRVGLNHGRFEKSHCGLSVYHDHTKTSLFLVGTHRGELFPYLFGVPSIPLKVCGGWSKNVFSCSARQPHPS